MPKVKMIKHDALIKIEIGAGFMERLQKILFYFATQATPEELEEYKKLLENKQELTEDWMEHLTTLTALIKELETKADEQGFSYESDLDESSITPPKS
jgi:hypothetical protein